MLEEAKAAMFTDEIAETSNALNQPHPGGTAAGASASAALPPPMLPPPLEEEEADSEGQEAGAEESFELEIFVVLVGAKEPHGPLTVSTTSSPHNLIPRTSLRGCFGCRWTRRRHCWRAGGCWQRR